MSNNFNVQLIKEQLLDAEIGDVVTFSQLSALTGVDIQFSSNHILRRALEELLEEENLLFENVRNLGYKKMSDAERAIFSAPIDKIQRQSLRGIRAKTVQNYESLKPNEQVIQQSHLTVLAIIKGTTSKKALKKLERQVKTVQSSIEDIRKIVENLRQ